MSVVPIDLALCAMATVVASSSLHACRVLSDHNSSNCMRMGPRCIVKLSAV